MHLVPRENLPEPNSQGTFFSMFGRQFDVIFGQKARENRTKKIDCVKFFLTSIRF